MSERDPAAARWAAIQLARAAGVACALVGILVLSRRALPALPGWTGFVLLALGLAAALLVPLALARRWRSPKP